MLEDTIDLLAAARRRRRGAMCVECCSWGTKFGVDGYFYLARGVYKAGCGPAGILLTNPSYPIMAQ